MLMIKYFSKKYRSLNLQIKVVLWFTIAEFIYKAVALLTTPIFTRILTTAEYGLFSVYTAWSAIFVVIATLNLHMGVTYNALIKMPDERDKTVSAFQSLAFIISLFIGTIGIILREKISSIIGLPVLLVVTMFISFLFIEPYQLWAIQKRYEYDYKKTVAVAVFISILTPIISVISILFVPGNKGEVRTISYAIVNIILPGLLFYIINYKKNRTFYNKVLWGYAISFNVPLIIHYLSVVLLNQTDRIMINWFYGSHETGIYSIASAAASIILTVTTALNAAFVPWQYQKLADKDYNALTRAGYSVLIFLALLLFSFAMFAPEIVLLFAGRSYMDAVYLIPMLGASVYFNYMYQLFSRLELFYEKKSYTVIATIIATALNIFLNIILLPRFGYVAAGISSLIAHIVFCVLHYIFYRKITRAYMGDLNIYKIRVLLPISLGVLIVSFVITFLYKYLFVRIILVSLIILAIIFLRRRIITYATNLLKGDKTDICHK